jgi:hypothetical protein
MVKVAIVAKAEHADDPAKVMAGLTNSILSGKLQGQFVTAAICFSIRKLERVVTARPDILPCCIAARLTTRFTMSWKAA